MHRRRWNGDEARVIEIKRVRCAGGGQLKVDAIEIGHVRNMQRAERNDELLPVGRPRQRGELIRGGGTAAILKINLNHLATVRAAVDPETQVGVGWIGRVSCRNEMA